MKPTLVVLAAGMGSRYGGLKQVDPVGPDVEGLHSLVQEDRYVTEGSHPLNLARAFIRLSGSAFQSFFRSSKWAVSMIRA